MKFQKGQIVPKSEFIHADGFARESYEGLLIASDAELDGYNIGIQLSEDDVLVVDHTHPENTREAADHWAKQVDRIQREHHVKRDPGLHVTSYSHQTPAQ